MQVLIAISGFCPRIGNVPCTTPFDFLFVISIHVPTWGTTLSISTNLFALIFQSTFPRGERLSMFPTLMSGSCISIHVPAWGTTLIHCFHTGYDLISIHVPAWGTTFTCDHYRLRSTISIHVPAWGTTISIVFCVYMETFQSTFPRGERHMYHNFSANL